MNKSELVDSIAQKSGLSKAQANDALNAFTTTIGEAMQNNDTVSLVGFGTFSVKERQARMGRNPQTKEQIEIPASRVPSFKAGKGLKDSVNGNGGKQDDNKANEDNNDQADDKNAGKGKKGKK